VKRAEYLPSAKLDLKDLRLYLTQSSGSRDVSRKFISRLRSHCDHLASLPFLMGKDRPDLGLDFRSTAFEAYVILFRYQGGRFQVVNVLEGHRDILGYFSTTNPE